MVGGVWLSRDEGTGPSTVGGVFRGGAGLGRGSRGWWVSRGCFDICAYPQDLHAHLVVAAAVAAFELV